MSQVKNDRNDRLEIFRLKVRALLDHYAEDMKIFIAENKVMGMTPETIKIMRNDPKSRWSQKREALEKQIKREVAGLINKLHIAAYMAELKKNAR